MTPVAAKAKAFGFQEPTLFGGREDSVQNYALDEKSLLQAFKKARNLGMGVKYDSLSAVLGKKLKKDDRNKFAVFRKIMMAETAKDLEGLTINDVLDCWDKADDFGAVFDGDKAGDTFHVALNKFNDYRTLRKRRVL